MGKQTSRSRLLLPCRLAIPRRPHTTTLTLRDTPRLPWLLLPLRITKVQQNITGRKGDIEIRMLMCLCGVVCDDCQSKLTPSNTHHPFFPIPPSLSLSLTPLIITFPPPPPSPSSQRIASTAFFDLGLFVSCTCFRPPNTLLQLQLDGRIVSIHSPTQPRTNPTRPRLRTWTTVLSVLCMRSIPAMVSMGWT